MGVNFCLSYDGMHTGCGGSQQNSEADILGKAEVSNRRQEKRTANNLYSSLYIVRVAKPRTMRWTGNEHVRMRRKMPTVFWWGSLNERDYMQDLNTFSSSSSSFLLGLFCIFTGHGLPYLHTHTHTRCPRRNVPDFGRVFLMLKYTDITQNTYIQS